MYKTDVFVNLFIKLNYFKSSLYIYNGVPVWGKIPVNFWTQDFKGNLEPEIFRISTECPISKLRLSVIK